MTEWSRARSLQESRRDGQAKTTVSAEDFMPATRTLAGLARAAQQCRGCALYRDATQTVFGEGLKRARLMLVGEVPGNDEDLQGRPFVGPAGRILDQALDAARIHRSDAYVTNVVKHFKWQARGGRRLHKTPSAREIGACLPWLEAEIELIRPAVLVCLGATAAKALLGPDFRVSRRHGELVPSNLAPHVTATGHPSAVLRQRTAPARQRALDALIADLAGIAPLLEQAPE
jgi:uracil-DNA glycosylase